MILSTGRPFFVAASHPETSTRISLRARRANASRQRAFADARLADHGDDGATPLDRVGLRTIELGERGVALEQSHGGKREQRKGFFHDCAAI